MIPKVGRYFLIHCLLSILLITVGLGGASYYFWNSGLLNGHRVSVVYETSSWLEDLKKNNYLNKMQALVEKGEVRSAYKDFNRLDKRIRDINRVSSSPNSYKSLQRDMASVKKTLDGLVALPEISKISKVLQGKLEKFDLFVANNHWSKLSQRSSSALAKVESIPNSPYSKVVEINEKITRDLSAMNRIAENSTLSRIDKRLIIERLKVLNKEVLMLENYLKGVKASLENFKNLKKILWELGPESRTWNIFGEKNSQPKGKDPRAFAHWALGHGGEPFCGGSLALRPLPQRDP